MFSKSAISENLIKLYLHTDYRVETREPFVMKVDVPSDPLAQLYRQYKCDCAAFLTACNPYSRPLDDAENEARQTELAQELTGRSLKFINALGSDNSGKCPGEPSFLVFGLSLETAKDIAKKYEQNAILWCGKDAVPQLILLR